MKTKFNRNLAAVLLAAGLVLTLSGCEDSGVNAPSDGNLVLTPAVANIVIPEGASEGSFTFTASLYGSTGNPLKGVSIRFVTSAGSWDQDVVVTDNIGEARATLTLLSSDPAEVSVQARASALFADATALKTLSGNEQPRASILETPMGEGEVGEDVIFDGTTSLDPDGDQITCFQWIISSDVPASNETVQGANASGLLRNYSDEQTMTVVLRVSDSASVGADCNGPAVIDENRFSPNVDFLAGYRIACRNTPPVADAGPPADVTISGTAATAVLDGRNSFDTDGLIVDYRWNCGNGLTGSPIPQQPGLATCIYRAVGTFTATLTVVDNGTGVIDPDTGNFACNKFTEDTTLVTVTRPTQ